MDDMFVDALDVVEHVHFQRDNSSTENWTRTVTSKTITKFRDGVWYVHYFDSNGGCALFSRPQAAYEGDDEAENIKFELVECTSCDITFSTMRSIMDKLQEYK